MSAIMENTRPQSSLRQAVGNVVSAYIIWFSYSTWKIQWREKVKQSTLRVVQNFLSRSEKFRQEQDRERE